jgi:[ribosomal protein S5]-alanine N-acetyltransferase
MDDTSTTRQLEDITMITSFPTIRTRRLLLRQFVDDDLENVFKGLSHPDVIKYYGVSFDTLEAAKDQMKFLADLEKNGTGLWWAICSPDNNTFYGAGGLNSLSKEHKKAEAGFWLLPQYCRKGIMTEALPLICDYGFHTLQLHTIEGFVETENTNCKNALAKLGFQHQRIIKDCETRNGKLISLDVYIKVKAT